jgi:hypothetical protein
MDKLIDKLEKAKLSDEQQKRVKKLCSKMGVGVSKSRMDIKEKKQKWLDSKEAKALLKAMPNQKNAAKSAWDVVSGGKLRPKYGQDNEAYETALDIIADKYM